MSVREQQRRRQLWGLLVIAAIILVVALSRADLRTVLPRGWWRL